MRKKSEIIFTKIFFTYFRVTTFLKYFVKFNGFLYHYKINNFL